MEAYDLAEAAERTAVPVELLLFIREAAGAVAPIPGDRIRDEELPYAGPAVSPRSPAAEARTGGRPALA